MIITVTREEGSQGPDLGRAIASALALPYYDHEIITRAARIANVSEATIEQAQRVPSLLSRMIEALGRFSAGFDPPEAAAALTPATLSNDGYRRFIAQVIEGLANGPGGVILGYGAVALLRGRADAVHVFVCAPFETRVHNVAAAEGITPEEARRRIRQADQERGEFLARYHHLKWQDPSQYDLALNSGRLHLTTAVEAVASLVEGRKG